MSFPSRQCIRHGARRGCTWPDEARLAAPLSRWTLALPNFQSRLLDGAGKRKRQRPRQSRLEAKIHGIQTGRGQFSGLAAGQKCNPRNGGGDSSPKTLHRDVGHFVHGFLRGTGQSRQHHVGFENHAFQQHALAIELDENISQNFLGRLGGIAPKYARRPSALPARRWGRVRLPGTTRRSAPARVRWPRCNCGWECFRRWRSPRATWQNARPFENIP